MTPVLEAYERICGITAAMRAAASHGEWQRLIDLEKELGVWFSRVTVLDDNTATDDAFRSRKAALIRKVLEDDAAIRACVEPRLADLQTILSSAGRERRLAGAYGAPGAPA